MQDKTIKTICAIFGIVILDGIALLSGIDGTLFALSIAALAGLAGYTLSPQINEIKRKWEK